MTTVSMSLTTERIRLRPWRDEDYAPFAELNADAEVRRHFAGTLSRSESDEQARAFRASIDERGWGMWALEVPGVAPFAGIVGLLEPRRWDPPCGPCIEVGWRLAKAHWGFGYASEGARAALRYGFERLARDEIVAFTATTNLRSQRVMQRLGMTRDPADDFEHPLVPLGHPVRPHVLYRLRREHFS